ncbi:MAG TPA: response regulator [Pyrinomonadaceae bacterium]|nr:response regulator [Pyrinomonadaceae bacterium]
MGIDPETRPAVLVVEDYDDARDLIGMWLTAGGYRVIEARDGAEAVEVARRECPDLVIMDMSLPTLDGLTATAAIRQIEALCDVPVIACSAHDAQDWADKALAAGCNEFVSKPVDFAALENALKRLLPQHR